MIQLEQKDYEKVIPLVKSRFHLSVFSVLCGVMPGKVFADDARKPTAALIRTSECNMLIGSTENENFNAAVKNEIGFWDELVPDTEQWAEKIPSVHPNRFVRRYNRWSLLLTREQFKDTGRVLPEDLIIEQIDPIRLRCTDYRNAGELLELVALWGSDENFMLRGGGVYLRDGSELISRSIWDCTYLDQVEIGIKTYRMDLRGHGYGILASAASVKSCFAKGYRTVGWHCVEKNRGSRAISKKLGFELSCIYPSFSSYPPFENVHDLTEDEWNEWGEYLERAAAEEPKLWTECLYAYIRANNRRKADQIASVHKEHQHDVNGFIAWLHSLGMAMDFPRDWFSW